MIRNNFKPAWWLNSGHLQTLYPAVCRRKINLNPIRERLELEDGDFLDLDWLGDNNKHIILILHGLAGSITSPYIQGMMNALYDQNWKCVLMNFRGCSNEPNRLARSYHSGDTKDLAFVVEIIRKKFPESRLSIIGYSLGGNVLLKWLGEFESCTLIDAAVAVSVPFDLSKVVKHIQTGLSKIYQWHLLNELKTSILKKEHLVGPLINIATLKKTKTFREFDELVTAPLHGFLNADDYYLSSSCRQYLKGIKVPTLIIHALDDPFMTPGCIPSAEELSNKVQFEVSQSGGHVGFISGSKYHMPVYWLEERVPEFLGSVVEI